MENEKDFEAFEEDFKADPAWYQVWCLGYDENENITDWDCFIDESHDPAYSIDRARKFIDEEQYKGIHIPDDVVYLEVLVETVVDLGDDGTQNVGNLFQEILKIK